MSNQPDRPFVPFNFSTFVPFDPLAVALNELPTPQLAEPEGEFTSFARNELPTARPSPVVEQEMLRLMTETAREGEWGYIQSSSSEGVSRSREDWTSAFCQQLNASLRHVQKRENNVSPIRSTPKRPRHSPSSTPSKPTKMPPVTRGANRAPHRSLEKRQLALRKDFIDEPEDVSHKREMRMRQMLKDVNADEFNDFITYLQRFERRPQSFLKRAEDPDESVLLATSSEGAILELRQRILLYAHKNVFQYAEPELLSGIIAILEKRIFESSRVCGLVQNGAASKESTHEATLGVLSAATVLAILSAPGSPRRLLVEELLDEIASLLKSCAMFILFPLCDPLYKESKSAKRRKKHRKNHRRSGRVDTICELGTEVSRDSESDYDMKRSTAPRRALLKKDETLLNHFCTCLDALSSLLEKEQHLPDSITQATASICIQSLSVTGISRVQIHAMKVACAIFKSYPQHRITMLDDVREAASRVPAARRHLRSFTIPGDQVAVRASSALLAQLLCAATVQPILPAQPEANGNALADADLLVAMSRKECHDNVVKLAMHALDPLLQRAYSDRDVEYRAAFQALFEDVLNLYGRPEWPSAELMLQTISVSILTRLRSREEKSVFARTVSINVLGALTAKMCELYGSDILTKSFETTADDMKAEAIEADRERLLVYLNPERSQQFAAASSFCEARFVSDDFGTASNLEAKFREMTKERERKDRDGDEVLDGEDGSSIKEGSPQRLVASKTVSRKKRVTERRMKGEEVSTPSARNAAISVGRSRNFTAGVRTILEAILDGLHDPAPTTRARSIKALSSIDESCHGIVAIIPDVLKFIEGSCRDVSTLARDAALDLLGRSLLTGRDWSSSSDGVSERETKQAEMQPCSSERELLSKIFSIVEKRLWDTATSVRKRAIFILKTALSQSLEASERLRCEPMKSIESMQEMRRHEARIIQISTSLVSRLDDPETTVREAAERTLRLGLFGFDISPQVRSTSDHTPEEASQLATRFVTVFARLPSGIHVSFISRIVHKALLIKHHSLLSMIVSAIVDQLHDCEANMARVLSGQEARTLSQANLEILRPISVRRVACASVIYAFAGLDDSLVVPHCRSLAPSVKGVNERGICENDLICVQKLLNVLEIGFKSSEHFDDSFLLEAMHDVEIIVCTSPLPILEEASVKCFCAVANRLASEDDPLKSAADNFHSFLTDNMDCLKTYCEGEVPEKPSALERNARGALVRLGLLIRYGVFEPEFVSDVYRTLETACTTVTEMDQRDVLPRASVRALCHFLIRHRSYLPNGTRVLGKVWSVSANRTLAMSSRENAMSEGIHLSILQGFHDLLRDEEDRNSKGREDDRKAEAEKKGSDGVNVKWKKAVNVSDENASNDGKAMAPTAKPVLAAEEDAEAGFLALSAQTLMPSFKNAVNSSSTVVRRMVANILGLLVRQGLLLPATVVTELFTLLLDSDSRCREYAQRVVSFLADRHSGMLASAAVSALRVCFENSFIMHTVGKEHTKEVEVKSLGYNQHGVNRTEVLNSRKAYFNLPVPTVEQIISLTVDERTGQSLLSPALMTMRREQRRGVFESMMREFDPRVVLHVESATENSNETRLQEDEADHKMGTSNGETEVMTWKRMGSEEEDDEVGNVGGTGMDISGADGKCSISTLYFMAITLACVDYTSGAGVGGSLGQGGGTAAAEMKLKYAKEDVTELVGIATRIISNSGQTILRITKQLQKSRSLNVGKKLRVAYYACRMSILLELKHHLKVERWKALLSSDEAQEEAELSSSLCRMPCFSPYGGFLAEATWNIKGIPQISQEAADSQLEIFCKLMRDDAIDEGDITAGSRKGNRSVKRRNSARKGNRTTGGGIGKEMCILTPGGRRVVHPRRASTAKNLRYDEDESEDAGSDFDPTKR